VQRQAALTELQVMLRRHVCMCCGANCTCSMQSCTEAQLMQPAVVGVLAADRSPHGCCAITDFPRPL
jgi:hypothetical protein